MRPRSSRSIEGPGLKELLPKRSAWGAFFAHFCGNYYWFFLLTWLPMYLVQRAQVFDGRHGDSGFGRVPCYRRRPPLSAGWYSDRKIAQGSVTDLGAQSMRHAAASSARRSIVPVSVIQDDTISIALLMLACMSFGVYTSNHWAITQTLAGPLAAGRWTSIQNGVGNLSGIAAPWLTGVVVEKTGAFYLAFVVAALVAFIGAFFGAWSSGPWRP